MIDGQFVRRGDTYNGSKVLGIRSSQVNLEDDAKSLKLLPSVEKRAVVSPLSKRAGKRH